MNQIATLAANTPPDTSGYMILAYLVIFLIIAGYIASLAIRWHRLHAQAGALRARENGVNRPEVGEGGDQT